MAENTKSLVDTLIEKVSDKLNFREIAGKYLIRPDRRATQEIDQDLMTLAQCYIAALLIGGGVTTLIFLNWEIDRTSKVALAIGAWILSSSLVLWIYSSRPVEANKRWREFAAILHILITGATLFLVSWLYRSSGDIGQIILTWMVLQYPLLYLTRSVGAWLIWLILALVWSILAPGANEYWWVVFATVPVLFVIRDECADWSLFFYLALLIFRPRALSHGYDYDELFLSFMFLIPWLLLFYQNISQNISKACLFLAPIGILCYPIKFDPDLDLSFLTFDTVLLWAVMLLCLPKAFIQFDGKSWVKSNQSQFYLKAWIIFAFILMLAFMWGKSFIFGKLSVLLFLTFLFGIAQHCRQLNFFKNHSSSILTLTVYCFVGLAVLCFVLSFQNSWSTDIRTEIDNFDIFARTTFFDVFFFLSMFAGWLYVAWRSLLKFDFRIFTVNIVPLVFSLGVALAYYFYLTAASLIFSVYFILLFVVIMFYVSIIKMNPFMMNAALFNFVVLLLSRLVEEEIDPLDTALALIGAGLAIVAFNIWLSKKAKTNTSVQTTER